MGNVIFRTVSRWLDSSGWRGNHTPGIGGRRTPVAEPVRLVKRHNVPLEMLCAKQNSCGRRIWLWRRAGKWQIHTKTEKLMR